MLSLTCGTVDLSRGRVERPDGSAERLTSTERSLLTYLSQRPGRDLSRAELLAQVWGYTSGVTTRALDTAVKVLRRKVEVDPQRPDHLLTVWGVGYRFESLRSPRRAELFGRATELAAIQAAIRGGRRVVTVWGPPGIGKSRLAAEAVAEVDGVLVALGGITEGELEPALEQALPEGLLRPKDERSGHRPRVLVLDQGEHLRDALAAKIPQWLAAAPDLQLVVTTRVQLGLAEEHQVEVGPLPLPDGAALLRRRLAESRRQEVTEPEHQLMALVEALGGHPVAIELAAARGAVLGLSELLRRGPKALDAAGVVAGLLRPSVSLLTPDTTQVLAVCLLFRGSFEAALVEAALPDHPDPVGALQRLTTASLIQRLPSGELGMVTMIREALPSLVPPPDGSVRRRLASALVEAAERSDSEARRWRFELLAIVDAQGLPSALRARAGLRCAEASDGWPGRDRAREIERVRALALASGSAELVADAATMACAIMLRDGPRDRAVFEDAVARARATGDRARVGWALSHLGTFERLTGEVSAAILTFGEAEAEATAATPKRRCFILAERAVARRVAGDVNGAIEDLERALLEAVLAVDPRVEQVVRTRLATTLTFVGRHEVAAVHEARAMELAEASGLEGVMFEVRAASVMGAMLRGDPAAAADSVAWCLAHPYLGSPYHFGLLHAEATFLAVLSGELPRAAHHAALALASAARRPAPVVECRAHLADGVWRAAARDLGARAALQRAARLQADPVNVLYAQAFLAVLPDAHPDEAPRVWDAARAAGLVDLERLGRALVLREAPAVCVYAQLARSLRGRTA